MNFIVKKDFGFAFIPGMCRTCSGLCCRGESGNIWVNHQDIIQIANFLEITQVDVILRHLNRIGKRFVIKECKTEKECTCIFFDVSLRRCTIYGARPTQCRTYPFWQSFRTDYASVVAECPGVVIQHLF